jgi:hypothetical protein
MHPSSQLLFDFLQSGTQPISASLPFKLEVAFSGTPADMGESKKVERFRFA